MNRGKHNHFAFLLICPIIPRMSCVFLGWREYLLTLVSCTFIQMTLPFCEIVLNGSWPLARTILVLSTFTVDYEVSIDKQEDLFAPSRLDWGWLWWGDVLFPRFNWCRVGAFLKYRVLKVQNLYSNIRYSRFFGQILKEFIYLFNSQLHTYLCYSLLRCLILGTNLIIVGKLRALERYMRLFSLF